MISIKRDSICWSVWHLILLIVVIGGSIDNAWEVIIEYKLLLDKKYDLDVICLNLQFWEFWIYTNFYYRL